MSEEINNNSGIDDGITVEGVRYETKYLSDESKSLFWHCKTIDNKLKEIQESEEKTKQDKLYLNAGKHHLYERLVKKLKEDMEQHNKT